MCDDWSVKVVAYMSRIYWIYIPCIRQLASPLELIRIRKREENSSILPNLRSALSCFCQKKIKYQIRTPTSPQSCLMMLLFGDKKIGTWVVIFLLLSPTLLTSSISALDPRWAAKKRRMSDKVRIM